jgi:hypothetical protein
VLGEYFIDTVHRLCLCFPMNLKHLPVPSLRRADHSFRGVLSTVVRRCVWSRKLVNGKAPAHCRQKTTSTFHTSYFLWTLLLTDLILILLTWSIEWAPNNASKWQMGFNSAFKGLNTLKYGFFLKPKMKLRKQSYGHSNSYKKTHTNIISESEFLAKLVLYSSSLSVSADVTSTPNI